MRGKFIAFEGIDGSGKSTQIKLLDTYLRGKGVPLFLTREPTDADIGTLIRRCLKGELPMNEKAVAALFVADRLDHVFGENGLLEKVESGTSVITDRYYLSSYAYHGAFIPMDWVIEANRLSAEALTPDLTVFLDVPPEDALERIAARGGKKERYEKLESLKRVREKYFEAMQKLDRRERFAVIRADGDIASTQSAVRFSVDKLFEE